MTLAELQRLTNQGFTAADLRALGIIPAASAEPEPQPEPIKPEKPKTTIERPGETPLLPNPDKPQPEAVPYVDPHTNKEEAKAYEALSAKLDALTSLFQAAARQGVNTGGTAKIIDPMEAGGAALGKLAGFANPDTK